MGWGSFPTQLYEFPRALSVALLRYRQRSGFPKKIGRRIMPRMAVWQADVQNLVWLLQTLARGRRPALECPSHFHQYKTDMFFRLP